MRAFLSIIRQDLLIDSNRIVKNLCKNDFKYLSQDFDNILDLQSWTKYLAHSKEPRRGQDSKKNNI